MKKLNKPSISVESIPEELKACNQWVMYRLMKKPGKVKPDRVPMRANFSNASVTNPKTWCSFDDAVSALKKKNFNGIGFVFTGEDPYCGIDMDSCVNPKTNIIESWAKDWIDKFASYTELSPSGTGVHIIVKGKLLSEKGKKKEDYVARPSAQNLNKMRDLLNPAKRLVLTVADGYFMKHPNKKIYFKRKKKKTK